MDCPRGGSDAAVTSVAAPEGGLLYTCFFSHDGAGHMSWHAAKSRISELASDGVTAELAHPFEVILSQLPRVYIEYGVLEYRLRLDYPDLFASHVAARGHVLTGETLATASSVRFPAALRRLERAGVAGYFLGPATGAWRYNQKIMTWALEPTPPTISVLTWEQYCDDLGRPATWTDNDRRAVRMMAGAAEPAWSRQPASRNR